MYREKKARETPAFENIYILHFLLGNEPYRGDE
jgi:hypothetical protein